MDFIRNNVFFSGGGGGGELHPEVEVRVIFQATDQWFFKKHLKIIGARGPTRW